MRCASGVIICTLVPVRKYFCTSKASEHLEALGIDIRTGVEELVYDARVACT
jgi:hypothetical protein